MCFSYNIANWWIKKKVTKFIKQKKTIYYKNNKVWFFTVISNFVIKKACYKVFTAKYLYLAAVKDNHMLVFLFRSNALKIQQITNYINVFVSILKWTFSTFYLVSLDKNKNDFLLTLFKFVLILLIFLLNFTKIKSFKK